MKTADLLELGLKKDEASVYLALMELGGSYVSAIAKKAKVHRVNCYKILDSLIQKGLINSFTKNNVKHFAVESPEILIQKQEDRLRHAKQLLPELLGMMNALAYKPKIEYYEGLEGIKTIFDDILKAKHEMVGYTNLAELPAVLSDEYIRNWTQRKVDRGIKTRMLSPYSEEGLQHIEQYYPADFDPNLVEILHVNPNEFSFAYEITIYDTKVAIVSLSPNELMGLIIESPLYADTQRAIFQLAWLGATSFVAR